MSPSSLAEIPADWLYPTYPQSSPRGVPVPRPHTAVVVVPTYDEAQNIAHLLDRLRAAAPDVDVLVVDDDSPDGTAERVAVRADFLESVFLLRRPGKQGLASASRAGFDWALGWGYQQVAQMDGDLSHPPERLAALFAALQHADVAVGSRYVDGGGARDWSRRRRLLSWAANGYVRLVLRLPVRDSTAGFRAFRRTALERLVAVGTSSNGYCFQIESTWRADRLGLALTEVPIVFTGRTDGSSKMSVGIVLEALVRVVEWRWSELRHRRRGSDAVPDRMEPSERAHRATA